ncbi:hypothetical protein FSB76_22130 [Mucilaginibacter ginsenosidivorax]|uniref:Helix-turn-helix domain-containing protein n=1 Tax=Mucilaginibacter ginsenosidivorax TaxID=862126 RepID=A0A5B8W6G4_9SPHI|nr:hypothetical protein FSB76_22130 [Mucilaginibacter ginsenosidivorax]
MYLPPLSYFFEIAAKDPRISVTHGGLYAAIIYYWQKQDCPGSFHVFAKELMQLAKISSCTTYHKCIRDLNAYGYLCYEASFDRRIGSLISFPSITQNQRDE